MKKAILLFLTAFMAIGAMAQTDIQELERKANAGDADAMTNLGACYLYGEGVAKNYEEALKWFKKGAKKGGHMRSTISQCVEAMRRPSKWTKRRPNKGMPVRCLASESVMKMALV